MSVKRVVSQRGDGDYTTITEAIHSIPGDEPAVIWIKNGVYHEKLLIEKKNLTMIGEDAERTVITYHDGAYHTHPDGRTYGTFRSYTVFLGGERAELRNLTIANTAGDGDTAGQAIALYSDVDQGRFINIRLLGHQDTLFLAPLPEQPRTPGSFVGPRETAPRKPCEDYFKNCYIEGDVDFIFGGAAAAFCNCEIRSLSRGLPVNGYITAACTPKDQEFGFIFYQCHLVSNCGPGTVFLGRPWREYAATAFLDCHMEEHILPQGWSRWCNRLDDDKTVRYFEVGSTGPGASLQRAPWVIVPEEPQKKRFLQKVYQLSQI